MQVMGAFRLFSSCIVEAIWLGWRSRSHGRACWTKLDVARLHSSEHVVWMSR